MIIPNDNFRFFHNGKSLFVSVKIPDGCRPYTVYMDTNGDNRPYKSIISDIQTAIEIIGSECEKDYVHVVSVAIALPKLLGYRRVSPSLK